MPFIALLVSQYEISHFDYGHSNKYHLLLFGKERHRQRSTLPMIMGFGQISSPFDYNARVL